MKFVEIRASRPIYNNKFQLNILKTTKKSFVCHVMTKQKDTQLHCKATKKPKSR